MSEPFSILLEQRDFSRPFSLPGTAWQVEHLRWQAVGGPAFARLRVEGDVTRLWGLVDLLRCGLRVCDRIGQAWWGYLSTVEVHHQGQVLRASLDEMGSRVRVRYTAPGPAGGREAETAWYADPASTALYGVKERQFTLSGVTDEEAAAHAQAMLEKFGRPLLVSRPERAARTYAVVEARGWWDMLDWTFYSEPRGLVANTALGADHLIGHTTWQRGAQAVAGQANAWLASEVWVRARKAGSPSDALRLDLCADGGGLPGAALAGAALPAADLPDDWAWVRFALPAPLLLAAGQPYWITLGRTGPPDAYNHYLVSVDQGCHYAGGAFYSHNGAWVPRAPAGDLDFSITGVDDTARQAGRMIASCAALRGARLAFDSGILGRLYRGGTRRTRLEVEDLLRRGDATGRRMLAAVRPDRLAEVFSQPGPVTARGAIGAGGAPFGPDGRALPPSLQPAGTWMRPACSPPGIPADGALFVEQVTWEDDRLVVTG